MKQVLAAAGMFSIFYNTPAGKKSWMLATNTMRALCSESVFTTVAYLLKSNHFPQANRAAVDDFEESASSGALDPRALLSSVQEQAQQLKAASFYNSLSATTGSPFALQLLSEPQFLLTPVSS